MNELLIALIPYIVPPLVAASVFAGKLLLEKLPERQRGEVASLISVCVQAVEQANPNLSGPEKKAAAVKMIGEVLASAHIKASPQLVDMFIEYAVGVMNEGKSKKPSVGFVAPVPQQSAA